MKALLIVLVFSTVCFAYPGLNPSGFSLYENTGNRWFVPSLSHKVYMGFTTGSSGSYSTGAYIGTMHFCLASNLIAEVSLGLAENIYFSGSNGDTRRVLGDLMLDWKPLGNLEFKLSVGGVIPDHEIFGSR